MRNKCENVNYDDIHKLGVNYEKMVEVYDLVEKAFELFQNVDNADEDIHNKLKTLHDELLSEVSDYNARVNRKWTTLIKN